MYVISNASATQTGPFARNEEVGKGNTVTCTVSVGEHPLLVTVNTKFVTILLAPELLINTVGLDTVELLSPVVGDQE